MKISVIIPALNEAEILAQTLSRLVEPSGNPEIIVVDGGSTDSTTRTARRYTDKVFTTPRGRGTQMDRGARHAQGDVLVFLHADTLLPSAYRHHICRALCDPGITFGAFCLSIRPATPILDLIAFMANLRSRLLTLPYGDQALFVRATAYWQVGGFQPWPVMEDVDLAWRLNRLGGFHLVRDPVETSARRWQQEGPVSTTLRNWCLMLRFFAGVPPQSLAQHYPDTRHRSKAL